MSKHFISVALISLTLIGGTALAQDVRVGHAIGKLKAAKNQLNADSYLMYLATTDAQNIYAKYGFLRATVEELRVKPL